MVRLQWVHPLQSIAPKSPKYRVNRLSSQIPLRILQLALIWQQPILDLTMRHLSALHRVAAAVPNMSQSLSKCPDHVCLVQSLAPDLRLQSHRLIAHQFTIPWPVVEEILKLSSTAALESPHKPQVMQRRCDQHCLHDLPSVRPLLLFARLWMFRGLAELQFHLLMY